eukprot:2178749-Pleurochrysis_carterae.AAC.5
MRLRSVSRVGAAKAREQLARVAHEVFIRHRRHQLMQRFETCRPARAINESSLMAANLSVTDGLRVKKTPSSAGTPPTSTNSVKNRCPLSAERKT